MDKYKGMPIIPLSVLRNAYNGGKEWALDPMDYVRSLVKSYYIRHLESIIDDKASPAERLCVNKGCIGAAEHNICSVCADGAGFEINKE